MAHHEPEGGDGAGERRWQHACQRGAAQGAAAAKPRSAAAAQAAPTAWQQRAQAAAPRPPSRTAQWVTAKAKHSYSAAGNSWEAFEYRPGGSPM